MENKNLKFVQIHMFCESIIIAMMAIYCLYSATLDMLYGLIVMGICLVLDLLSMHLWMEKKKVLIAVRIVELLAVSALIVYNPDVASILVAYYMIFLVRMLEIIFLFDYSDAYTRTIVLGLMVLPITIFMIIKLIFTQKIEPGNFESVGEIATIALVVLVVARTSDIFTGWLTIVEHKIFEQRRMAEKSNEMNETLRIHQEKVRKANEELGIQRIKMESANRLINKANIESKTQNEVLKQITTCLDLDCLAEKISSTLCDTLEHQLFCCVLLLPLEKKSEPVFSAKAKNISDEFMKAFSADIIGRGIEGFQNKQISIHQNLTEPVFKELASEDNLLAVAELPLSKDGKPVGVILCGSDTTTYLDECNSLLENIIAEVMLGYNNISLYHEIQMMAITDGLTGLLNRRRLNAILERYNNDAVVNHVPLAIAMIDIDHFKQFNDKYGHACGDMVLCELAKLLEKWAENYGGIAARYGGEEFVIAIMDCELNKMEELLTGLKNEIDSAVYNYDGNRISIRVSMGYTGYPEICLLPAETLNRADNAMYYSKEHGRNRITRDSEEVDRFIEERGKAGID